MNLNNQNDPFRIPSLFFPLSRLLESLLGLRRCSGIYAEIRQRRTGRDFFAAVLDRLGVTYAVADEDAVRVAPEGPAIVIANHPFGGIEGLMLIDCLQRLRPDVRVLANSMLCRIPELRGVVIPVNPFGGKESGRANIAPMREGIRWVRGGGLLVVFPAGEVSHLHPRRREISDPSWNTNLARLVRKAQAPVLLRHYLNLGGKLLAFNLDPDFGDVLDGLILVDLMQTDSKTLGRYMGKKGLAAFRSYHEILVSHPLADCA